MTEDSEQPTGSRDHPDPRLDGTADLTGHRVGHFRVVRFLGRGGMASVWLAEQEALGRRVALKFPHRHLAGSSRARRRFLDEARAAALLDHPRLSTVFDYGLQGDIPYIAMALVEGESLGDRRRRTAIAVSDALRWSADVASALAHAHGRGVLHGDVTPNNIVIDQSNRASLIDFGLAVLLGEDRFTQANPMGTVHYVAPEIIEGRRGDPRSDLYGLGVVLYEAVVGRLPFESESHFAYLLAATKERPLDPRHACPALAPELAEILLRAIARDANARYQSATEFELALLAALGVEQAQPPIHPTALAAVESQATTATGLAPVTSVPDPAGSARYELALASLRRHDSEAAVDGAIRILRGLERSGAATAAVPATLARACLLKGDLTRDPIWIRRARRAAARARNRDAEAPETKLILAELLRLHGRLERSVRLYRTCAEVERTRSEALLGLSRAEEALGNPEGAALAAQRAIAAAPDDWRAYSRLAAVLFNRGESARSIAPWKRALALCPDNARAWWGLGSSYFHLDRFEDALQAYRESIHILPTAIAFANAATALFYMGQLGEAASEYEKAVSLAPTDPNTWGNFGTAARRIPGFERRAMEALDRAISLHRTILRDTPSDARGWAMLSGWLAHRGLAGEAREAIERALELAPEDPFCLYRAGGLEETVGNYPAAIAWFAKAVRRGYGLRVLELDPFLAGVREHEDWTKVQQAAEERRREVLRQT